MIEAATVSIVHDDGRLAGREAAMELMDRLSGPPDLVIAFVTASHRAKDVLEGLWSRLPASARLAGCSTAGEINSEEALVDSVTVMGLRSREVEFATFKVEGLGRGSFDAGRALGTEIKAWNPQLVLLFPDALRANATQLLRGLQSIVGEALPILGGMAADSVTYTGTFQLHGREALDDSAVAIGMRGKVDLVTRARSGWMAVGNARTCTRVENGTTILELDGQPALDLYEGYLGDRAAEMPAVSAEFPLGLVTGVRAADRRGHGGDEIIVCRGIRRVDKDRRAIVVGADLPQGGQVRMMRATKQDVLEAGNIAGASAFEAMPEPSLALLFNCAARKLVLGRRYKQDIEVLFERLGPAVPKIGFHTYGEFCPVGGASMYHEVTFTVALLKA